MTLLELREVVVTFGGLRAVDGVSLRVEPGAIVGLIGPNGAGKSTIIDAVTGFVPIASGAVVFDGEVVTRMPAHRRARRGLARTFQSLELFEDLTVTENVLVPTSAGRLWHNVVGIFSPATRRADEDTTRARLAKLGLGSEADENPNVLSQADRRGVALARALARQPKLVMLDEPAAGLDAAAGAALGVRLRELVTPETAILLVDHDMSLVLGTCDYVYVIDTGRLIAEGPPAEVRRDGAVLSAYLGEQPAGGLAASSSETRA
jgi:branched-chain amino acid transport system ATP-binding protein